MTRRRRDARLVAWAFVLGLVAASSPPTYGQERPLGPPEGKEVERGQALLKEAEAFLRPSPLEPIPDDPPPHEGALFEMTYRIEPPDLILVEVLEALPGRPITGERLVRPDGKISLGFYGEVHVAGLTTEQAKVKLVLHLRRYLEDQALGLIWYNESGRAPGEAPPLNRFPERPPAVEEAVPVDLGGGADLPPLPPPFDKPATPGRDLLVFRIDGDAANPEGSRGYTIKLSLPPPRRVVEKPGALPPIPDRGDPFAIPKRGGPPLFAIPKPGEPPRPPGLPPEPGVPPVVGGLDSGRYEYISPRDSHAVFVEVSSYNSQVYYIQGDVGSPGRLTCTGNDTVLDAMTFGGGFLPSADKDNLHLYRPERGGKPAKDYRIDYRAIERGDKKANLQILPGDRLVIERKAGLQPR